MTDLDTAMTPEMGARWPRLLACLVALTLATQACVSIPPRNPVPEEFVDQATIPDIPFARMWADAPTFDFESRLQLLREQMLAAENPDVLSEPKNFLAISGGGANGAYGAGFLKGWTESGERPEFWIVTGISTGALIAPFAFLGSQYDDELEELYTTLTTSDLIRRRSLLSGLTSDAMADTAPLMEIMKEHVDDELIDEIAEEYRRGRRIYIGTTNLDTQRPVIWNIGGIAEQDTPESRQLIRDVMLASASIPGAFPPVRLQVVANGETYDELHVDGGTTSQVFIMPQVNLRKSADALDLTADLTEYILRNGKLAPSWVAVKPKLAPVLMISISTLIRTQGLGDLYRIYLGSKRDNIDFNLAYIPDEFDLQSETQFDPQYMRSLFDLAYEESRSGYEWHKSPPGVALP